MLMGKFVSEFVEWMIGLSKVTNISVIIADRGLEKSSVFPSR